jgi:hypothetical protein
MGGPNLEVFKVCLDFRVLSIPDILMPCTVRHVHHVPHSHYVLLWYKPRQSIFCTRFLAQTGTDEQGTIRERGNSCGTGEIEGEETIFERTEAGEGGQGSAKHERGKLKQ